MIHFPVQTYHPSFQFWRLHHVFSPVNDCVPVETTHRAPVPAFGRLNVCVDHEEMILKSFHPVPVTKNCIAPLSPLRVQSLLLNRVQSAIEMAPVDPDPARAREIPVHAMERPLPVRTYHTLLLNVFQSVGMRTPVVVALAVLILKFPVVLLYTRGHEAVSEVKPILFENIFQSARDNAPVLPDPARPRESTCHERERPFGLASVTGG